MPWDVFQALLVVFEYESDHQKEEKKNWEEAGKPKEDHIWPYYKQVGDWLHKEAGLAVLTRVKRREPTAAA